jgi:transaldolase
MIPEPVKRRVALDAFQTDGHPRPAVHPKKAKTMTRKSVLEKLWEVQPLAEIWWDSSPLVFPAWRQKMLEKADDKALMAEWIDRLYSESSRPEDNLFRGVTTNPRLSFNVIKENPDYWTEWIDRTIQAGSCMDVEVVFWETYKEIVKRGALACLPLFESTGRRFGYISGQTDPRVRHDADRMVAQGVELHALSPNIMIKIPGTAEGYDAIRRLTARGIPTNNTLAFIIPQFIAGMQAVSTGLIEARKAEVDLTRWRSVMTFMSARFGTLGDLQKQAQDLGIELSEADVRWAEIAIFQKACRLLRENPDYTGKMLICSMRMSPVVDGRPRCWHLEKAAGADVVYTCPPSFLEALLLKGGHLEFSGLEAQEPPSAVMDKLLQVPYFERAYREDGYSLPEFNTHPALVNTAREFGAATQVMVDFIAKRVADYCG